MVQILESLILKVLQAATEPKDVKDIAYELGVLPQAIRDILNILVQKGYLNYNRITKTYVISERGKKLLKVLKNENICQKRT